MLNLYDSVNHTGLFDVLGPAFAAIGSLNTAVGTTVPTKLKSYLDRFKLATVPLNGDQAVDGLSAQADQLIYSATPFSTRVVQSAQSLIASLVNADAPQSDASITAQLQYVIAQMISQGYYVTAATLALSVAAGGSNTSDAAIAYTYLRGDGLAQENMLAEDITLVMPSAGATVAKVTSALKASAPLAPDWPKGSGLNQSLGFTSPGNSLLSNGNFENWTIPNVPDNWVIEVGTPGTTILQTAPCIQTVAISGTPTGGSYVLQWPNAQGVVRTTAVLAYNASQSTVQSALRAIPELANVSVVTTGTTPNFTHTITFTGLGGTVAAITSTSFLTGGTPVITVTTTQAGNAGSYRGLAMQWLSDGSELTSMIHGLALARETVYFAFVRLRRSGTISAGALKFEVIDEPGGSVINDSAGNPCHLSIDPATVPNTAHGVYWFSFRLPANATLPVYLRLRVSTAFTNATSIYVDDMMVDTGLEQYPGGPFVRGFQGVAPVTSGDNWVLTASNDRGDAWNEYFDRGFGMSSRKLLLPTSGSTLIPNSLIA